MIEACRHRTESLSPGKQQSEEFAFHVSITSSDTSPRALFAASHSSQKPKRRIQRASSSMSVCQLRNIIREDPMRETSLRCITFMRESSPRRSKTSWRRHSAGRQKSSLQRKAHLKSNAVFIVELFMTFVVHAMVVIIAVTWKRRSTKPHAALGALPHACSLHFEQSNSQVTLSLHIGATATAEASSLSPNLYQYFATRSRFQRHHWNLHCDSC